MDGTDGRISLLACGVIEVLAPLANSSNETFLVNVTQEDEQHWAVYKPELGERPLRDFPPGLHRRERAAYLLSESLGWGIVPPTVVRDDAPFGTGSLQWFVEHDPDRHYFTLFEEGAATHGQLRRMAVFDLLANNADRKAGHVLRGSRGRLWGIDHGLCFAAPLKLRTVIWDFAGERIDAGLLADVGRLADALAGEPAGASAGELSEHLSRLEVEALLHRARAVLLDGGFPLDATGMRIPWPLI